MAQDQLGRLRPVQAARLEAQRERGADANPDYWRGAPKFKRVITRHIPEPATQRLLLEKGDIDIARKLSPRTWRPSRRSTGSRWSTRPRAAIWYLGLNQKNQYLAKPEVREALKWLVDYDALVGTILKGKAECTRPSCRKGFLGAIDDTPYRFDLAKAKELLAKAGLPDGFKVTMDTRNNSPTKDLAQAIQATWAQAGVEVEIIPGDDKQT